MSPATVTRVASEESSAGLYKCISDFRSSSISRRPSEPTITTPTATKMTTKPTVLQDDTHLTASDAIVPVAEESEAARIQRLGRQRPAIFKSLVVEVAFVFSIIMSQIITEFFVSGFGVILPTLMIELNIPRASSVWPASAFSLVIASTLLFMGRLGDLFGGYTMYLAGLAWFTLWSVIAGFSINPLMLDMCRAFQGLGAAAFLPSGTMLMGRIYRPGPRKNLVFSIYGTCAVAGFFVGIFTAGIVGQFLRWGWYFWIGALITASTLTVSVFAIPNDHAEIKLHKVKMDWWGSITMIVGLILVTFALTESSHAPQGWRTPYIPTLLIVGLLSLGATGYIELRVAEQPLIPAEVFKIPSMMALFVSLTLLYGSWGIYIVYGTQYFQNIMHASPLLVVAWYTPTAVAGLLISMAEGFVLHLIPGQVLLIAAGLGALGAQLLIALLPAGGGSTLYWPYLFPAMVMSTIGIDMAVNVLTVFVTTQLPSAQQGLAGGLINTILQLGVAFILAFADIAQTAVEPEHGLRQAYKATFWLGVGVAGLSLGLMTVWGRIPRAVSDLTVDEKRELAAAARQEEALSKEKDEGRNEIAVGNEEAAKS